MIEYERLDIPGHDDGEHRHTIVDAQVRFRFHGGHTHAAAIAEAESRLTLIAGIDIRDMDSTIPVIPPQAEDIRYVATHTTAPPAERLGELQNRIACALDMIAEGVPSASTGELLDLIARTLTRDGYRAWVAEHPGWPVT